MMESWTPPRMWPGATVYVIGGGPSLKNLDLDFTRNRRTIVTNNAYKLAPWAEILFFMDHKWYQQHAGWLELFTGIKVHIADGSKNNHKLKWMQRGSKTMLSHQRNIINHGNNSGYCAVHLAYLLGAAKIILVGFDMKLVDNEQNFHNDHQRKMRDNIYEAEYIPVFDTIRQPLQKKGVTLLNMTENSGLKNIPFISLERAIAL